MNDQQQKPTYAAIDLGSNSFHMVVAEPEGDSIRIVDSLRVSVRLGSGLDDKKRLTKDTLDRGLDTLKLFAERLREVPLKQFRVVGTNTLRRAKNADDFVQQAREILGKNVEIISGREEARLIYAAVAHTHPDPEHKRLVCDIGGGSTELIVGHGLKPLLMESVNMGCISVMNEFFGEQQPTEKLFDKAITYAELELEPLKQAYQNSEWSTAIGCSGTIKATGEVLAELGITDGVITRKGLKVLRRRIIDAGSVQALNLSCISQERSQVIVGGIAVLSAVLRSMKINTMLVSQVALREGIIFAMLGKREHTDIQQETLSTLNWRFSIDEAQAKRVEATAMQLFSQVKEDWQLEEDSDADLLCWAARLHEIGMGVAHSQYHKHGAYIVQHCDLFGFSKAEQNALSMMIRYHRRKIELDAYSGLPEQERSRLLKLTALLRLAALLHRGRHDDDLSRISLGVKGKELTFSLQTDWIEELPLTHAALESESPNLALIDVQLKTSLVPI